MEGLIFGILRYAHCRLEIRTKTASSKIHYKLQTTAIFYKKWAWNPHVHKKTLLRVEIIFWQITIFPPPLWTDRNREKVLKKDHVTVSFPHGITVSLQLAIFLGLIKH